jgi:hypothetical protein
METESIPNRPERGPAEQLRILKLGRAGADRFSTFEVRTRGGVRPMIRTALACLAAALLVAPALTAHAKEESKIQVLLLPDAPGNGNGNGNGRGSGPYAAVKSFLQDPGSLRKLQLQVKGLAPGVEHVLLAYVTDDGSDMDPGELCRFTTEANGGWTGSCNIGKGDDAEAPVDPRGKYLAVNDGGGDVLVGWLYGAAMDDGPGTKVKELTRLAPDETTAPSGSVDARYDMRPNGKGSFGVSMRGVPPGDYDVCVLPMGEFVCDVDDVVETLTPNPGGNAKATFRTQPSKGKGNNGKGHNKKGMLDFDPRRAWVVLKQGDQVYFEGEMLAQIDGLNVCTESTTPLALTLPDGAGNATLEVESDCESALFVDVTGMTEATYDVLVDGLDAGDLVVAPDGSGSARFDPTPDEAGELPLTVPVTSASSVELVAQP